MSGSALLSFFMTLIALGGGVAIILLAIGFISPDPTFTKIARIAIGVVAVIIFLGAVSAVLFGGGGGAQQISGINLIWFAIAVIVILIVVWACKVFLAWLGQGREGGLPFMNELSYIIAALALIAFLYAAATFLLGGTVGIGKLRMSLNGPCAHAATCIT